MIRLVDCEEEWDAEEERLRAILEARHREQRQQEAAEAQRKGEEAAEAEAAAREVAEEKQNQRCRKQLQRKLEDSMQDAQVNYRIPQTSPSRGTSTPSQSSKMSLTSGGASKRRSLPARSVSTGSSMRKRPVTPEITIAELEPDYFQPLQVRQPAMSETMKLSPGVSLGESGRVKAAPVAASKVQMTRKEYLRLCDPERTATPCATPSGGPSGTLDSSTSMPSGSVPAFDGQPTDDLGTESSQLGMSQSRMSMGCGNGRAMGFAQCHPSMRGTRDRRPTAGMRDFLHRSLKPTAGGMGSLWASHKADYAASGVGGSESPASATSRATRLSAGGSCGSLGSGGKIVANRDLLRQLLGNVR